MAHGQARHKTLQAEHTQSARAMKLSAKAEVGVKLPDGKQGRLDHIVYLDKAGKHALITEFKTDRFDKLSKTELRTRVKGYISQMDSYRRGTVGDAKSPLEMSQTILHIDERPQNEAYARYIEGECFKAGIMVFFLDE